MVTGRLARASVGNVQGADVADRIEARQRITEKKRNLVLKRKGRKAMGKNTVIFFAVSVICFFLANSACNDEAPKKIVFGQSIGLTGGNETVNKMTILPIYEMWIEQVNAKGGLYISKYDKKIPIELLQYDNETDEAKLESQLKKLILEDRVHFLLPPGGTEFLFTAAPIANKYSYILVGGAGGALKLKEITSQLPYFFSVMNDSDTQMPVLADIMKEVGVQRVAVLMIADLSGEEYSSQLLPHLAMNGIDIVMVTTYDEDNPDFPETIVEAMVEAESLEADAFVGFTYPQGSFALIGAAMEMGYNPKLLSLMVGPCFSSFRDAFGAEVVDGIVGTGAWNNKSCDGAKSFEDKFVNRWASEETPAEERIPVDYWGGLVYWAGCQFLEQAIEKAGTLEQDKIRDVMGKSTFETDMGPVKFDKGRLVGHRGQIGQWQDGVFEVIDPEEHRTAEPVYPKPEWPVGPPDDTDDTDTNDIDAGV
jgi:branched-chain amino acid transport system substrate-binding protein